MKTDTVMIIGLALLAVLWVRKQQQAGLLAAGWYTSPDRSPYSGVTIPPWGPGIIPTG